MRFPAPLNYIAEKLLYLLVRSESLNAQSAQSLFVDSEDHNTINIYVLESRAWSDLLVLGHESKQLKIVAPQSRIKNPLLKRWHHVYSVAQSQPLKTWLTQSEKTSPMLSDIEQTLLANPELDVNFIPVVIFWGRPVVKQKHWLRVLFSDTWGLAGRTRRFFTILINGRNTLLQFSPAIPFRELLTEADSNHAADKLQTRLSERLTEIKTATLGPDISHRRTLVNELLENDSIAEAIMLRSTSDKIPREAAAKIAYNYLNEIVADRSYITIQIFQRILTAFWNKFYSGIEVLHSDKLKTLALTHELVYVPCHRSHVDYLLLSYVIHFEGMAIPYIAAGKNLNMPVIGPILRKSGAFFIRRSFKGNALYSTIMFEYVASQLSTGMPIEYFIEGGRSRTGRLLQPKPGMLAMTIRAFLKYKKRPIAFIPVYVGYEKMLESKSYLAELEGQDKKSETLFSSLRSMLKIRGFYGRVTASFGEPVLLSRVLDEAQPDWELQSFDDKDRPEWLKSTVSGCSKQIMQGINSACAVNSINLISTALLATSSRTMDEAELMDMLSFYKMLIDKLDYAELITRTQLSDSEIIEHAEKLKFVQRRQHELGDFIALDSNNAIILTYYRNNTLHLFALPSLIACCFNSSASVTRETIYKYIRIAYPFLKTEFFLPWEVEDTEPVIDKLLQLMLDNGLLEYDAPIDCFTRPAISTEQHARLSNLSQIIAPVLELYYMIFAMLADQGSGVITRPRLEELCYLMAQRISLVYQTNSPDFFDKRLIANFIDSLLRLQYVMLNDEDKLEISELASSEGVQARRLLDKDMQYNILQMLRKPSH